MLPLFFSNYAQRRQATYFAQNYAGKIYLALVLIYVESELTKLCEKDREASQSGCERSSGVAINDHHCGSLSAAD